MSTYVWREHKKCLEDTNTTSRSLAKKPKIQYSNSQSSKLSDRRSTTNSSCKVIHASTGYSSGIRRDMSSRDDTYNQGKRATPKQTNIGAKESRNTPVEETEP